MRHHWIRDRVNQGQFKVYWEPGQHNLADYPTKHHSGSHHRRVRPIYLYEGDASPTNVQGCVDLLKRDKREAYSSTPKPNARSVRTYVAYALKPIRNSYRVSWADHMPANNTTSIPRQWLKTRKGRIRSILKDPNSISYETH